MGRTNPTFRDLLRRYREDWGTFRRGLRVEHQPAFDALFDDAESHADAAGLQNAREPMHAILVAMALAQKRQIRTLTERVETLESRLDDERVDGSNACSATDDAV